MRGKENEKCDQNLRDIWDTKKHINIHILGVQKGQAKCWHNVRMNRITMVTGMGAMREPRKLEISLTEADIATTTAKCEICKQQRQILRPQYNTIS